MLLTVATVDFRLVQEARKCLGVSNSVVEKLLWGGEESLKAFTVLDCVVGVS
jgi:hypothetical protein